MNRGMMAWLVIGVLVTGLPVSLWALPSRRTSSASDEAKTAFQEGLTHQRAGRYAEAVDAYERSLARDSNQAEALNNLGFCYKALKRYHKAVQFYKAALDLDPNLAEAYEYLGEAYLEMGKVDLAKRAYRTLVTLDAEEAEELKEKIDAREASQQATPTP